jgi:hypothetical protein
VAVNFVRIFLLNPNFLLEHRKFSSRTYAIVPQKYRELFMQVETCEQSYYSFNARWKKNFLYFLLTLYYYHQSHFNLRKFLLGFFFYRNNEIQTFYYCVSLSCFWIIVVFLLQTLKEKLPIFLINTLLLHIPLLALTDRQNNRGTELQRNKYTRCTWAGGIFFPVVLSCQFLVLAGNRFWFTYLCT